MKYTGKLNKPIVKKPISAFFIEESYRAELERIDVERAGKLPDLFEAHGVEPGNWVRLSLALAQAHVPGFKIVEPAGRPTEWGLADKAEFRLDVDTIVIDTGNVLPVTEAIKRACKLDAWASKTKPMTLAAITKHYYTADLRFVEVVKDARAWDAHVEAEKIRESIVSTN